LFNVIIEIYLLTVYKFKFSVCWFMTGIKSGIGNFERR